MIHINNHEIVGVYDCLKDIVAVYNGLHLVWSKLASEVLSCYYNGYWIDDYPWTDDTPWTD
jgi:hypothetical protein